MFLCKLFVKNIRSKLKVKWLHKLTNSLILNLVKFFQRFPNYFVSTEERMADNGQKKINRPSIGLKMRGERNCNKERDKTSVSLKKSFVDSWNLRNCKTFSVPSRVLHRGRPCPTQTIYKCHCGTSFSSNK